MVYRKIGDMSINGCEKMIQSFKRRRLSQYYNKPSNKVAFTILKEMRTTFFFR